MSDTPRTDAAAFAANKLHRELVNADFARQLERELARVQAVVEAARKGLTAVRGLINDSRGVVGLHLNGDEAPWDELLAGGQYESWLFDFSAAQGAFIDFDAARALDAKEPKT